MLFRGDGEADRLGWKAMPFARDDLDSNCAQEEDVRQAQAESA